MTDGGVRRSRDPWEVDCQDCSYREVYTEPTSWKTIEERAKNAVGGHRAHNPLHQLSVQPTTGEAGGDGL